MNVDLAHKGFKVAYRGIDVTERIGYCICKTSTETLRMEIEIGRAHV